MICVGQPCKPFASEGLAFLALLPCDSRRARSYRRTTNVGISNHTHPQVLYLGGDSSAKTQYVVASCAAAHLARVRGCSKRERLQPEVPPRSGGTGQPRRTYPSRLPPASFRVRPHAHPITATPLQQDRGHKPALLLDHEENTSRRESGELKSRRFSVGA